MTEVPEHLLRRSRERRAALGLGGGSEGGAEAPASKPAESEASATAVEKAPASAPATPEPAAPATPPPPTPPYLEAALERKRIPYWAMPVLAFLPIWAIIYAGSLSPADTGGPTQLSLGAEIYAAQCAACHGPSGGGGVGRPLSGGDVLKTFPNIEQQLEFVAIGSDGVGLGNPYGDPDREGGAHISGGFNGNIMPAFGSSLTEEELLAVVRHEREVLSGEELESDQFAADGTRNWSTGEPMLDASTGLLITPDGEPLFDEEGKAIMVAGTGGAANAGQLNPADE